jgi:hypothetical protein
MTIKNFMKIATICLLLGNVASLNAQVTIGADKIPESFSVLELISNDTTGLRLPQMTTVQRNAVSAANGANLLAKGLVIYNTTNDCVEYWNGTHWISLCEGNSQMTIGPAPCQNVAADGTGCDSEFEIDDPDCEDGPFEFRIVAGQEFADFASTNEADGKFTMLFQPNNSTSSRSIVVRVTASCTGLFKDFLFTQLGQPCSPTLGNAPTITAVPAGNNINLCTGGAVYLSVPLTTPNLDSLIWTRNNVQIAQGVNNIVVTQNGVYDVHMGFVGCGQAPGNSVTVNRNGTVAPAPVSIITGQNNGFVCDAGGTTQLFASTTASGTIVWYQDGIRTTLTGSPIDATLGNAGAASMWFAVVEDGTGCSSTPSNEVTVQLDPNAGTPITPPMFNINGNPSTTNPSVCIGGSLILNVTNDLGTGYTYTWYVNDEQVGTGVTFELSMAGITEDFVLQCRVTGSGCSSASVAQAAITAGTAPAAPFVSINPASGALCDGSATLTANTPGITQYSWYKDGVLIPGENGQNLVVAALGSYTARAWSAANCVSSFSAARNITVSSASGAQVTIQGSLDGLQVGQTRTFTAVMDNPQMAEYTWTVTGAQLTSGQGTAQITVNFNTAGNVSIALTARNACGNATVNAPGFGNITVTAACTPVQITGNSSLILSEIFGNSSTNLSITATGTPTLAFQWYKGATATPNPSGDTPVGTGNTFTTPNDLAATTHWYYCVVTGCDDGTNPVSQTSPVFTLTVTDFDSTPTWTGGGSLSGRTCFDVAQNTPAPECGEINSRLNDRYIFANTPTQLYTFAPVGSVTNVSFAFANLSAVPVINSIAQNGNQVTVTFNTALDTEALNVPRSNALRATLFVLFNVGATQYKLPLTLSVADCACCPGLLIPGGAFTEIANVTSLGTQTSTSNTTTGATNSRNAMNAFQRSGQDLCIYYRDASTGTFTHPNALTQCNGTTAPGVDAVHRPMGWRLPNIAELAQIGPLVSNNAGGNGGAASSNPWTQAMIDAQNAGGTTTIALPGATVTAPYANNLRQSSYWSSTRSGTNAWNWFYSTSVRLAWSSVTGVGNYVRCVRSF